MPSKIVGHNIGYIRVSTIDQKTDRQLDGLQLHKTFIDKCSGKDTNRPQLELMLDFVREGDTVYVHSMDRLARNLDDLRRLVDKLTANKVKISFIKENMIFTGEDTSMAKLMLSVMGAFAEFERSLIKERQKEGIALAKKAGKYRGRSKCLTEEQIIEMRQMIADRYKKTEIAKKFGICRDTLYRYIRNLPLPIAQISLPNGIKTIKIVLRLVVENNSQWVRGKKKTYEEIEMFTLPYYSFEKTQNDHEYILTIKYKDSVDLDQQIEDLYSEIWSVADNHHCFIDDTSIYTRDKEKYWY